MSAAFIIALAYLIGSIPFAVLVSRSMGLSDPRSYGSGNPGATNVLRTGNRVAAVVTLLGDGLKGWLAVWLAQRLGAQFAVADWTIPAVALGAFVGHVYPVFHRFAGGKGVATAGGIIAALHWPLALALAALWLIMAVGFKISSLASLTAATLMPIGMFYVMGNAPVAWSTVPIAALLFWRHRNNIRQLLAGKERVIGR